MKTTLKLLCLLVSGVLNLQAAEDMVFRLPTDNDALYRGDNEGYFMYCDRWFEGKHSRPWQAGSYGFTRNELRILQVLMENQGHVVSRDALMERLWETDCFVDENTLSVNALT